MPEDPLNGEFLLYSGPDGRVKVECRFHDETLWLTQRLMADLFGVGVPAINKHLKNIFESGELDEAATLSKMEIVRSEGGRDVRRKVDFYNLDAIIAVGYRVNSYQATQFRIWATRTLKEFIISAYLDLAENRARRGIVTRMSEWVTFLNSFLELSNYPILQDAGKISALEAKLKAEAEYEVFRKRQDLEYRSDFDEEIRRIQGNNA